MADTDRTTLLIEVFRVALEDFKAAPRDTLALHRLTRLSELLVAFGNAHLVFPVFAEAMEAQDWTENSHGYFRHNPLHFLGLLASIGGDRAYRLMISQVYRLAETASVSPLIPTFRQAQQGLGDNPMYIPELLMAEYARQPSDKVLVLLANICPINARDLDVVIDWLLSFIRDPGTPGLLEALVRIAERRDQYLKPDEA